MSRQSDVPAPYALVVDDDALIRMDALDILTEAGFRTFDAVTGDQAIAVLKQHHASISVLVTDVQMPGSQNGFAVARETAGQWPHISIVVASGQARPCSGDLPEGARFICKPYSAEMITDHLREILPNEHKPVALRD